MQFGCLGLMIYLFYRFEDFKSTPGLLSRSYTFIHKVHRLEVPISHLSAILIARESPSNMKISPIIIRVSYFSFVSVRQPGANKHIQPYLQKAYIRGLTCLVYD